MCQTEIKYDRQSFRLSLKDMYRTRKWWNDVLSLIENLNKFKFLVSMIGRDFNTVSETICAATYVSFCNFFLKKGRKQNKSKLILRH